VKILRAVLQSNPDMLEQLADFYGSRLGLEHTRSDDSLELRVGYTALVFRSVRQAGGPFYHFAVRIPRNRFAAAQLWLDEHAGLLTDADSGETRFDFANWNAEACYAHDPAGNILELIAHHELPEETTGAPPFGAQEWLGLCEMGLVGNDIAAMGSALQGAGIGLWDGSLDEPGRLAFVGGRDGVLILSGIGRGWLPTGRPAEAHPVDAVVEGPREADVQLPSAPHRVRVSLKAE
jgi:catechol 2,3-dioxygenase-like lactoylglutathione lyase family enzyme